MPLTPGPWKAVVNGVEGELEIKPPDGQGAFSGTILGRDIRGFWNEAAQRIRFAAFGRVQGASVLTQQFPPYVVAHFEGHVFRVPADAEPGRDVTVTIVGAVDGIDLGNKWQSESSEHPWSAFKCSSPNLRMAGDNSRSPLATIW
jgi:hypothetical protein